MEQVKIFLSNIIVPKLTYDNEQVIRLPNNIKNKHGLIFDHIKICKRKCQCPHPNHNTDNNFIGFHIKNYQDGIHDQEYGKYIGDSNDKPFSELFNDLLNEINTYTLCNSCGNISNVEMFNFKTEQCFGCDINDHLSIENNKDTCSVCCEEHTNMYTLKCGHKFHRKCLVKLQIPKKCPNCREYVNESDKELYDEEDEEETDDEEES